MRVPSIQFGLNVIASLQGYGAVSSAPTAPEEAVRVLSEDPQLIWGTGRLLSHQKLSLFHDSLRVNGVTIPEEVDQHYANFRQLRGRLDYGLLQPYLDSIADQIVQSGLMKESTAEATLGDYRPEVKILRQDLGPNVDVMEQCDAMTKVGFAVPLFSNREQFRGARLVAAQIASPEAPLFETAIFLLRQVIFPQLNTAQRQKIAVQLKEVLVTPDYLGLLGERHTRDITDLVTDTLVPNLDPKDLHQMAAALSQYVSADPEGPIEGALAVIRALMPSMTGKRLKKMMTLLLPLVSGSRPQAARSALRGLFDHMDRRPHPRQRELIDHLIGQQDDIDQQVRDEFADSLFGFLFRSPSFDITAYEDVLCKAFEAMSSEGRSELLVEVAEVLRDEGSEMSPEDRTALKDFVIPSLSQ